MAKAPRASPRQVRGAWRTPIAAGLDPRPSFRPDCRAGPRAMRSTARLWDLEAKRSRPAGLEAGRSAAAAVRSSPPSPSRLAEPEAMEADARAASAHLPLLKLKLAGEGDRRAGRGGAARRARRAADRRRQRSLDRPRRRAPRLRRSPRYGVELIEQPVARPARIICSTASDQPDPVRAPTKAARTAPISTAAPAAIDAINIKLDKAGGLTEAMALAAEARDTRAGADGRLHARRPRSASRRPSCSAQQARWVDLDGRAAAGEGPAGRRWQLRWRDACGRPAL